MKGKERLKRKADIEMDIVQALRAYDKEQHPVGETLSESVRMYRVRVLMAVLKSGVALAKIECFRDLFEENALVLTSVPNMRQLLAVVLTQETQGSRKLYVVGLSQSSLMAPHMCVKGW